jgi:hypothetical protein
LAISLQEKLLFVGEDFSKTDVEMAQTNPQKSTDGSSVTIKIKAKAS